MGLVTATNLAGNFNNPDPLIAGPLNSKKLSLPVGLRRHAGTRCRGESAQSTRGSPSDLPAPLQCADEMSQQPVRARFE